MFLLQHHGDNFPLDKQGQQTKPSDHDYPVDQQEALIFVQCVCEHNRVPDLPDPDSFPWPNPYYEISMEELDIPPERLMVTIPPANHTSKRRRQN